jgi:hypothetical protein
MEFLEQYLALSVTSALVNGQSELTGDATGNTIILDHSGGSTIVTEEFAGGGGSTFGLFDQQITASILIKSGSGNDTVDIQATVGPGQLRSGPHYRFEDRDSFAKVPSSGGLAIGEKSRGRV